ncbi:MAG: DUF3488 and DUF4129 domain-containing transglutaminase family protein [Gammaproteobacteria bacterium]
MELTLLTRKFASATIRPDLLWLFAGISLAVLPHIQRLPVWISILFFSLTIWRLHRSTKSARVSRRHIALTHLIKLLVGLGIVTGILLDYGTLAGRDAGVALLILLTGMKFLEIKNSRDYYITSFIGLFLILTCFFYSQSIVTAVYMLVAVTVFILTLIGFNDKAGFLDTRERLHVAGSLLLQSLPLMLVMFLLFPRVSGPLWGLPRDAHSGRSGISDEMSPGTISRLALSDEIAFRVKFADPVPANSLLYWRGPVLSQTDGVKWVAGRPRKPSVSVTTRGLPTHYTVTLEPTENNWLYALEIPAQPPKGGFFSHDLVIKTRRPVHNRRQYSLISYTDYRIAANSHAELLQALQLPYGYHRKAVALGRSWRKAGLGDAGIVRQGLRLFNREPFYYTLTPPRLQRDTVDQFLFETRRGFCEHYAAAFVILMRAAGIPARIITGYQGGTVNPIDGYLVIRQRDAHAWAEVWLEDRGWVRIDPTSAVAPARISAGIESALPESIINVPLGLQNSAMARRLWQQLHDTFDAINNRWNQWVLAYDTNKQLMFMKRIGLGRPGWERITVWLILAAGLVFLVLFLWLLRQRNAHTDRARTLYDQFCDRMAKIGISRDAGEGPKDFASRAIHQRNDLGEKINAITDLYVAARYGGQTAAMEPLQQHIKSFKPARLIH